MDDCGMSPKHSEAEHRFSIMRVPGCCSHTMCSRAPVTFQGRSHEGILFGSLTLGRGLKDHASLAQQDVSIGRLLTEEHRRFIPAFDPLLSRLQI